MDDFETDYLNKVKLVYKRLSERDNPEDDPYKVYPHFIVVGDRKFSLNDKKSEIARMSPKNISEGKSKILSYNNIQILLLVLAVLFLIGISITGFFIIGVFLCFLSILNACSLYRYFSSEESTIDRINDTDGNYSFFFAKSMKSKDDETRRKDFLIFSNIEKVIKDRKILGEEKLNFFENRIVEIISSTKLTHDEQSSVLEDLLEKTLKEISDIKKERTSDFIEDNDFSKIK